MFKPLRGRLELIFIFELFQRWRVEEPHAFIGYCGRSYSNNKEQHCAAKLPAKPLMHARMITGDGSAYNCRYSFRTQALCQCHASSCRLVKLRSDRKALPGHSHPKASRNTIARTRKLRLHLLRCFGPGAANLTSSISFWPVPKNLAQRRCITF